MKLPWDVYESLRSPITFPFTFKRPRRAACCGGLQGAREWRWGGTRVQGEMLIMGRMKGARAHSSRAEWCSVSRLPHTLAHSMLIQLHKLPRNYPEGTLREGGKTGETGRE